MIRNFLINAALFIFIIQSAVSILAGYYIIVNYRLFMMALEVVT